MGKVLQSTDLESSDFVGAAVGVLAAVLSARALDAAAIADTKSGLADVGDFGADGAVGAVLRNAVEPDEIDAKNGGGPPIPTGGPPSPFGGPPMPTGGPPMPTGGPPMPTGGPPILFPPHDLSRVT